MKIAIVGCGAMGSVYAALLATAGNEVLAIDSWEAHVAAIAASGLRVEGASGDRVAKIRVAVIAPDEPFDLVILAVKASQVAKATEQVLRLVGPATKVLTIQNGVGSAEIVAARVGPDRLAVGIAGGFGASIRAPGHVRHEGMEKVRLGAYGALPIAEVETIAACWRDAGFNAEAVNDIVAMQWEKLMCNVAYSAPCALTGLTVGVVMDDPDIGPVSRAAAVEAWTMALANKIAIAVKDPVQHVRDFGSRIKNAKSSMLLDHENRRRSEIDVINGAVTKAAAKAGLEAPVNATLVSLVKQRERDFAR